MSNEKLYCQNRQDWDEVKVWDKRRNKGIPALRINVDKMDRDNQQILSEELKLLSVQYSVRRATSESKHVHKGDKTVRVSGEANIEKLSKLFGNQPAPDKDWRNLRNWDDKDFYLDGFVPLKGKCLNLKDKTKNEIQHICDVLDDLDIHHGVRAATKATPRISEGDKYLRVTGKDSIEKLVNFTKMWTPHEELIVKSKKREGGR